MKTHNKPGFAKLILTALTASVTLFACTANAGFYNLGSLDVAPVAQNGGATPEWFVEYLKPGESLQEKIRISNFGTSPLTLAIYAADTAKNDDKQFFAKNPNELSDDIAGWIHLPTDTITLEGGQSKIISTNFIIPENAGVGLHTGAVIVRNMTGGQDNVIYEKGIRVYLNVTGAIITKSQNVNASMEQSATDITTNVTTNNKGTTDITTNFDLVIKDVFGTTINTVHREKLIKPGTTGTTALTIPKPGPGFYTVSLKSGQSEMQIANFADFPIWAILFLLAIILLAAKPSCAPIRIPDFSKILNSPTCRRSFTYIGVLAVTLTSTVYMATLDPFTVSAQTAGAPVAHSYSLTAKWGNFRNLNIPNSYKKLWDGKLSFSGATVSIEQYLNFESDDKAELTDNATAVRYTNSTGPDNDGITIKITPSGEEIPQLTYSNLLTGETYTFPVTDCITAACIYPDSIFAAYFKTDFGPEHALSHIAEELSATPELLATPPATTNSPELANLFLQELPATPETLANFVLTSDYVRHISTEQTATKVDTNTILIDALQATPDVLSEITATPELNYIFVPTENIVFPAQEFSFDKEKTSSKNIGTIIFVQNKSVPWNTYISTTDFVSLSGRGTIPSANITIIPGEYKVLGTKTGAAIRSGDMKQFKNKGDKNTLVTVSPGHETEQIFTMNPTLQVTVPPGTIPGHYRGTLTITSL
jgi:hypothetical protein